MRICPPLPLLLSLLAAFPASAAPDETLPLLQNWFNDPFFQISAALAACPLPAGPFVDAADRRLQAHRRAEKGTTCWLSGECERPNAYAYDQDIAAALRAAVADQQQRPLFLNASTLWVTVQGRVVYIEGCAARPSQGAEIESFIRALPHVQQATAILRTDPLAPPPYRTRPAP